MSRLRIHEHYWPGAGFCDRELPFSALGGLRFDQIDLPDRDYREGDYLVMRLWEGVAGHYAPDATALKIEAVHSHHVGPGEFPLRELLVTALDSDTGAGIIRAFHAGEGVRP